MNALLTLDPPPDAKAAERLAMLLALPVSDDPQTPEEIAIFERAEADIQSGRRGHTTEEIELLLEQMRRDADG